MPFREKNGSNLLLVCALLICHPTQSAPALPVLTNARDVQALPPQEAKREYPVQLRAIVTYVDTGPGELFVQDNSSGIFVFIRDSTSDAPLRTGQLVAIRGVSTPADFTPSVTKAVINVLGQGSLPTPRRVNFDQLLAGKEDSHWGEMEGVIRSGKIKDGRLTLNIAAQGGAFLGVMHDFPADWEQRLVDAKVVLHGVIAAIFNERRQSIGIRLFVPGIDYIRIEEPPPTDALRLPLSPANSVGQFVSQSGLERRIHVRVTVTGIDPGNAIYVADEQGSLAVRALHSCPVKAGDLVDIAGFPGAVDGKPGLLDAICRLAGGSGWIKPSNATARDVLPASIDTAPLAYALQAGMRYDLKLIRIDGSLLRTALAGGIRSYVLQAGDQQFTASLKDSNASTDVPGGSLLQLTGVCLVGYDQYHRAQSFRILLREPADIVILARPPWLNLRLALWGLGLTVSFFVAALVWVMVLRSEVAAQTLALRIANESLLLLSSQDALTGVANRRKFDETLEAEFSRAQRFAKPLSLVMVDIDHFKLFNDMCGHQRGDACLMQVARTLDGAVQRNTDLVSRYGGEEFAVILPGTNQGRALEVAERMRAAVERLAITHPASIDGEVLSISAGIATFRPGQSASPGELVAAADRAMYRAKLLGRNRVVSVETTPRLVAV